MKRTINFFLIYSVLILTLLGCSKTIEGQNMQQYQIYREGPHITLRKNKATALYFRLENGRWITEKERLEPAEGAKVTVDNPVLDPFTVQVRPEEADLETQFPNASKVLVISDIEGNLGALYQLLIAQAVIDDAGNWTFGEGHLLMLGDLFDRGPDVTPLLWLLYKLEAEALSAGGRVHILLGNHELMIFQNDLRYIHSKYKNQSRDTRTSYSSLFDTHSLLGRWLRNKPAIIRIGDMLFSHAGISPSVFDLRLDLESMNDWVRKRCMGKPVSHKAQRLFGSEGIFWYRDWVDNPPGEEVLDRILNFYNAQHMIIGHTIVPRIQAQYDFKLIQTDLHQPHALTVYPVRALRIENKAFFEVDSDGGRTPIQTR